MKKSKSIVTIIFIAVMSALCLCMPKMQSASGTAYGCRQRVTISDDMGNQIDYVYKKPCRQYKLAVGESYLLYIGMEGGGAFSSGLRVSSIGGISYDLVSFEYDCDFIDISEVDGCTGGFFVVTCKQPCDNAVVNVTFKEGEGRMFFNDFSFSVTVAKEV